MTISVIIPVYNAETTLPILLDSMVKQTTENVEVIVVDDCSTDNTPKIAEPYNCKLIRLTENRGPAYCRNIGAKNANGNILVFTDSDCRVSPGWTKKIQDHFSDIDTAAIMGKLIMLPSTFIGNAISGLGFPAGGSIGFEKIWKVDNKGFTSSLSSCNCAIRQDIFHKIGGFDETFPFPGGEDSFLAYCLKKSNHKIKYCPDAAVYHEARNSIGDFIKWQFKRGISSFLFSKKVSDKADFISLRMWSTTNILKHFYKDMKLPLILFLLALSFSTQLIGFLFAKHMKDYS